VKYFVDTEFIESGRKNPVTLISIGIVAEDGREFYAVSSEFSADEASDWVRKNVIPYLGNEPRTYIDDIRRGVLAFIGTDKPEFWGYYADYDWVVLCQLFGAMVDLPKGWPMFCRDIKQMAMELGNPRGPKSQDVEHNALSDARWNKFAYEFLLDKTKEYTLIGKDSGVGRITDERLRQIRVEGWTAEHDDAHDHGEMAEAASCYTDLAVFQASTGANLSDRRKPLGWPTNWEEKWWKPSSDPIRNLEKAGALIAAEIDRLKRKTA
jgi:3' exoribonuclease, RNase T-like